MSTDHKHFIRHKLQQLAIWFLVITVVIYLYADTTDPIPVTLFSRLLIAAGIVAFLNIPLVKTIGQIYLKTTPDDADLDDV